MSWPARSSFPKGIRDPRDALLSRETSSPVEKLYRLAMKPINRREALITLSSASSVLLLGTASARSAENTAPRTRMGIVTYAFGIHQKNQWAGRHQGLAPALALLEESHELGAAGIQVDLGPQDADGVNRTATTR